MSFGANIPHRHHSSNSHHHRPEADVSSEGEVGVKIAYNPAISVDSREQSPKNIVNSSNNNEDKSGSNEGISSANERNFAKHNYDGAKDVKLTYSSTNDKSETDPESVYSSSSAFNVNSTSFQVPSPSFPSSTASESNQVSAKKLGSSASIPSDSINSNEPNYYSGGSRVSSSSVDSMFTSSTNEPYIQPNFGDTNYDPSSSSSQEDPDNSGVFSSHHDTISVVSPANVDEPNEDTFLGYPSSSSTIIISSLMIIAIILVLIVWLYRQYRGQLFTSMIIKVGQKYINKKFS